MAFRTPKGFPNNIPGGIIPVLSDAVRDAIKKNPAIKRDVIRPKAETPTPQNSEPAVTYLDNISGNDLKGMKSFYSRVRTLGIARPNKFLVEINGLPSAFSGSEFELAGLDEDYDVNSVGEEMSQLVFFTTSCESAQFPGTNFLTQEYHKYGQMLKVPYQRIFEDVTLSFRCDGNMLEKKFFDRWTSIVQNTLTGDMKFKDGYVATIKIAQLSEAFQEIYVGELVNAYPVNIQAVTLAQDQNNSYVKIDVTFTYDFFRQLSGQQYNVGYDVIQSSPSDIPGTADGVRIKGTRKSTPYERAMRELLKIGKSAVGTRIIKKFPVGNIPGIGNPGSILDGIIGINGLGF